MLSDSVSDSLQPYRLHPIGLLCPWDFPGKSTEVSSHFLPQGSNLQLLRLLHWQVSLPLSHLGSDIKAYYWVTIITNHPQNSFHLAKLKLYTH